MKDFYSKYNTQYTWLLKEEGWVKSLQAVKESQFAIGNGFLGTRAVLEEIPYNAKPGTYITGLYDRIGSKVSDLVNLPNPFNFKIVVEGQKLGVTTMDVLEHKRTLNLRHGFLCRHSVFQDAKKRKYDYQSMRFVSMHDKNIGVMQVAFTALDNGAKISIETGLDTSVHNSGTVTEGRKKHFRVKELGQVNNTGYLAVETFAKLHTIIFRSGFYYETKGKRIVAKDNIFELKLRKNQTIVFTKIFSINASSTENGLDKLKKTSERKFNQLFPNKFKYLLKRHIEAWEKLWDTSEVSIWGDPEIEKDLRFNIYHMLICGSDDNGFSSVGARALTGEGYHGHIFWDAEIFVLPFYLYALPNVARNMLLYRYRRLDVSRAIAKRNGFKGAMFAWESAGIGEDETPAWAKDLDGKIIRIHTGKREHHITADIAYAVYHYYNATRDEAFMRDYGYEIMFETARFWASRVTYNKKKETYEIKNVIGPDEFHEDVNNNVYTNMMAKWNLLMAHKMFQKLKKLNTNVHKELIDKIGLSAKETRQWRKIAARMIMNKRKGQVIEQFDGYFKKKKIKITDWDENYMPIVTTKLTPRDYKKTQLVKQADVVMLLYILADFFHFKTKKENYKFYVDRTLHKSSLSLPVYALMALEVGDRNRAYRFFNTTLHTDIGNVHNNTDEGIHAACIGGTWQVLINGFAGVKIQKEALSINPKLPSGWRKILFSIHWRGSILKMEIKNSKVKLRVTSSGRKKKIKIRVFGVLHEITGSKTFEFERKKLAKEEKTYYF